MHYHSNLKKRFFKKKDLLNCSRVTVKTFIMLQKIFNQRIHRKLSQFSHKYLAAQPFSTMMIISNISQY